MKRALWFALALAAAGCDGAAPRRPLPPPADGSPGVTLKSRSIAVEWIRSDPWRRTPLAQRGALDDDRGLLVGFAHDRFQHYSSGGSLASYDVAFLSADGRIVDSVTLPPDSVAGTTSKAEARYALFLARGWLARHDAGPGDRVTLPPEIAQAPPEPLPEVHVGSISVRVETSSTYAERVRGLMYRRAMSEDDGMLFIYPRESDRSFWMGHCYFGLDIAYFDASGALVNVVEMDPYADPENAPDETVPGSRARSEQPAQFALEVRKGWFRRKGLLGPDGRPARAIRMDLPEAVRKLVETAE